MVKKPEEDLEGYDYTTCPVCGSKNVEVNDGCCVIHCKDCGYSDLEGFSQPTCPSCGSENVIVEMKNGFFCVKKCNNCGYSVKGSCFK